MIIPGAAETAQIIDGSEDYAVIRHLRESADIVAFAVPALALVAELILKTQEPDKQRLENALEKVLAHSKDDPASGLMTAAPRYRLLNFGRDEVRAFARLLRALPKDRGTLEIETLTIIHLADVPALLVKNKHNQDNIEALTRAGLGLQVDWIT